MRYYIGDCHFGHEKAMVLDKRPFSSVEEMDEYMIARWNQVVKKRKDEVIILGDLSFGRADRVNRLLPRLNGKKCLIVGNHDRSFAYDKKLDRSLFSWVGTYRELHDNNRMVVLSHYPMICYNGQYQGDTTYMLYGHVHGTKDYENVVRFVQETRTTTYGMENTPISCHMINCFAGFSDYKPLTLDQWIQVEKENQKRLGWTEES